MCAFERRRVTGCLHYAEEEKRETAGACQVFGMTSTKMSFEVSSNLTWARESVHVKVSKERRKETDEVCC